MELSENLKLNLDAASGGASADSNPRAPGAEPGTISDPTAPHSEDSGPTGDAESQMRKALGLMGEAQRHRPEPERMDHTARMGDRFNGGLHRRRFVQDGDVPVTVLRREPGLEPPAHRGVVTPPGPTSSRLQRTEAALAAETASRDRAERSLTETQGVVRDLQTKIGHAELAKSEAIEALRREREAIGGLRAEVASHQEQLRDALEQLRAAERSANLHHDELAEERNARRIAEKALRMAEAARESAEQLVRALSDELPAPVDGSGTPQVDAESELEAFGSSQRRGHPAETARGEPEPVKWWLNTKQSGKKR